MFCRPASVKSAPFLPRRVGKTQSNMSTPRATAFTRSSGLPTPMRYRGFVDRQLGIHDFEHRVHITLGLSHREPSDAVPRCIEPARARAHAIAATRRASLPGQCRTSACRLRPGHFVHTSEACVRRHPCDASRFASPGRTWSSGMAISTPSATWTASGYLRRVGVFGAVDMRAEADSLLLHLAEAGEAEDLEAAGIREDRALPVHESMDAARARSMRSWPGRRKR